MVKITRCLLVSLVAFLVCSDFRAESSTPKPIDLLEQPDYLARMVPLIEKLAEHNAIQKTQVFYLSKIIVLGDGSRHLWIYCPRANENKLILFQGYGDDLTLCHDQYNLKTDVVDTENDVHGSSFVMTKAEAQGYINKCQNGNVVVIVK